jgi:hypothetical protein
LGEDRLPVAEVEAFGSSRFVVYVLYVLQVGDAVIIGVASLPEDGGSAPGGFLFAGGSADPPGAAAYEAMEGASSTSMDHPAADPW